TSTSEYQAKRPTPWSSSPRFSNGATTNGRDTSHVLAGDGRFFDQLALVIAHSASSSTAPAAGRRIADRSKRILVLVIERLSCVSRLQVLHLERLRVLLRPGGVEGDAV